MAESDLDYAKVTGRYSLWVGDTDDAGDNPDVIYCNQGTVEFTPLITFAKVAAGTPWPFEGGDGVIVAQISDEAYVDPTVIGGDRTGARDGAGHVTYRGKPFVKLFDLTSTKVNPRISDPAAATYSVAFKNVKAVVDGTPVTVNFPARPGRFTKDGIDGDGVNDLVRILPVVVGSSTPIIIGPTGVSVTAVSIVDGTDLEVEFSDGSSTNAGELPVGPGGSDPGVATYLANRASETSEQVAEAAADTDHPLGAAIAELIDALTEAP